MTHHPRRVGGGRRERQPVWSNYALCRAYVGMTRSFDFPLADLLRPGLTVVAQGEAEIGRTTIDLLRARLADPSRPIQTVTVPTTLIPRGSGELPA
jgi:DNA-binding LacI/PurR family transcriptional regulator